MSKFIVKVAKESTTIFETEIEIEAETIDEAKELAEEVAEDLEENKWKEKISYLEFISCQADSLNNSTMNIS